MRRIRIVLMGLLVLAGGAPLGAAPAPLDALLAEFRGQAPPVTRSASAQRAAYAQVVAALVARMRAADAGQRQDAARALEAISFHAGRPGAEPERAALCRAMLAHLGARTPLETRLTLLTQLERIGRGECVALVAALLQDRAPRVRERALRVLQANRSPAAGAALRQALAQAKTPALQVALANALGYRREPASVTALAKLLRSREPAVAAAAASALGTIGGSRAAAFLATIRVLPAAQPAVDDARARCAAALPDAAAETVYQALAAHAGRPRARALGLTGLVRLRSPKALAVLLDCLQSNDRSLVQVAAQACASITDPALTNRVLALYPKLDVPTQVAVLAALADRGDAAALPVAVQALESGDPAVAAAALEAVGTLGGAGAVLPLARVAATGAWADRQAARDALTRLRGAEVEAALLETAAQGPPNVRAALMTVLADRTMTAAVPLLLQAAEGDDVGVAVEALKALGRLGGAPELPALAKRLLTAPDEAVREAAQEALVAVASRAGNPDQCLEPLFAGLATAPEDGRCVALAVLAQVGGRRALAELTAATRSPIPAVKRAAVAALAESWEDGAPLDVLWNLARADAEETGLRVRALRGCLRLLARETEARPAMVVARLAEALAIAGRPEEKKLALSVLRDCRVPAAVTLAAGCLDDPTLAEEAAEAVLYLAAPRKKGEQVQPAVVCPETLAAVAKVRQLRGETLPAEWSATDVGDTALPGSTAYANGTFTLKASGWDVWGRADGFHFVAQLLSGDGTIVARVGHLTETNEWAKAGVMIRDTPEADSAHAFVCVTPKNGLCFQRRRQAGADSVSAALEGKVAAPYWVKLTRVGDRFTAYASADGQTWQPVGEDTIPMGKDVLVGLAVSSHDNTRLAEASMDQVQVTR
ncbi:MAG: hypothetical protein GX774_19600 [Armatimonadetes bacterium]|nr:hypothetical protein [Armatimonadota bacterium]